MEPHPAIVEIVIDTMRVMMRDHPELFPSPEPEKPQEVTIVLPREVAEKVMEAIRKAAVNGYGEGFTELYYDHLGPALGEAI